MTAPDAKRASAVAGTQKDAIDHVKSIVGNAGGGEVRIHGKDVKIRDADTVKPGNDPQQQGIRFLGLERTNSTLERWK